jgi:uroporphyrinogen decarboxylase
MESKASMDVRRLAPKYGDRLSFFGNIDVMKMMTNDRATIEEEVRTKLAAGMLKKGYIYHSDHSVPPQVSWDTYQFIISLLDKYGNYH